MDEIQQELSPCCICFEQKDRITNTHYICTRCSEGVVCLDCAIELWTNNAQPNCPVCRNDEEPWYNSYDEEAQEEIVCPDIFINRTPSQNHGHLRNQNSSQPGDCLNNMITLIIIFIISWFYGMIILLILKINICLFKCKSFHEIFITIIIQLIVGICLIICLAFCIKKCMKYYSYI